MWKDPQLMLLAKLVDAVRQDPDETLFRHLTGTTAPAPPAPATAEEVSAELAARRAAYAAQSAQPSP